MKAVYTRSHVILEAIGYVLFVFVHWKYQNI